MARTRSKDKPMSPAGCFIKFRLELQNIKYKDVAKEAKRSVTLVSQVISGERRSEKVQAALASLLGFGTYTALLDAAYRYSKAEAV